VTVASDGAEGLEVAQYSSEFDVLVLDVMKDGSRRECYS
jgi:hypothetical protein